MKITYPAY